MKFLALISILLSNVTFANTIKIAAGEWVPFQGSKLKNYGCIAELISKAFSSQGYKVEYSFFPWKRSYILAKIGKFDGTSYWFDRKDRREDFLFPERNISVERSSFYYKKGSGFSWQKMSDLRGKTIVINDGLTYPQHILDDFKKYNINKFVVNTRVQNFKIIAIGRADVTLIADKMGDDLLSKEPKKIRDLIVKHPRPVVENKGYLLISRKTKRGKKLLQSFNLGFKKVFEDPLYRSNYIKNCSPIRF